MTGWDQYDGPDDPPVTLGDLLTSAAIVLALVAAAAAWVVLG